MKAIKILFILGMLLLISCTKNTLETTITYRDTITPPGVLYFLTDQNTIYSYKFSDEKVNKVVEGQGTISDFDVSTDGQVLTFLSEGSKIGVKKLVSGTLKTYVPPALPAENLSIDATGKLVAFQAQTDSGSIILFLNTETQKFSTFAGKASEQNQSPLFSPSGMEIAWANQNGLFFKSLVESNASVIQLSDKRHIPISISPGGNFLTSDSAIFDLVQQKEMPTLLNGKSKFLDDFFFLYEPENDYSLILTDIGEVNRVVLLDPIFKPFPFDADISGNFAVYSLPFDTTNGLRFNFLSQNRVVFEKDLSVAEFGRIRQFVWRNEPVVRQ